MRIRRSTLTAWVTLLLAVATPAVACLWDNDTLRDERRGLPGIAEVLAGKWERHSDFFYRDRIERMNAALAADPNDLAAYDNLAVAYEKLGDQDKAIEAMLRKEKAKPGEYTTYANLGTFYLHKGDFENGIRYIEKALAINPDAHFGREEYQLRIAKFLRDTKDKPALRGETNFLFYDPHSAGPATRPMQARMRAAGTDAVQSLGLKPNVFDGILGMIRFGTGTSPDLYYALADLLHARGDRNLAYRAYQRALELGHPGREHIRTAMKELTGRMERQDDIRPKAIARERAEAAAWVKAYQDYDDDLIRSGKDVDDEANYADFYKRHGYVQRLGAPAGSTGLRSSSGRPSTGICVAVGSGLLLAPVLVVLGLRLAKGPART